MDKVVQKKMKKIKGNQIMKNLYLIRQDKTLEKSVKSIKWWVTEVCGVYNGTSPLF